MRRALDGERGAAAARRGGVGIADLKRRAGEIFDPIDLAAGKEFKRAGVDHDTGEYTPPDGYVNVTDVQAFLLTVKNYPSGSPYVHRTWVDLHGLCTGNAPNYIPNVADLQRILFALAGTTYTATEDHEDPGDCPDVGCRSGIGENITFTLESSAEIIDLFASGLGRRSTPEEQAYPMIFLNSAAASYIAGENVHTDGGTINALATGALTMDFDPASIQQ